MLPAKSSAYQNVVPLRTACGAANQQEYFGVSLDTAQEEEQTWGKNEMVSMVSHDLRAPLTALRVSVGMFLGGAYGDLPPEALKRLECMETSVDLLIRMINDLLDIEKIEAGQLHFNVKHSDSETLIDSAVSAVKGIAESKSISIKTVGKKVAIKADSDRIIQVLINLLSNAIKFSPVGSTIEVHTIAKHGLVEFRVVDQGNGIAPSLLRKIFEPFEQVHQVLEASSGLGLAICKKIVEAHGGQIGVDSRVGNGSQFWFKLKQK